MGNNMDNIRTILPSRDNPKDTSIHTNNCRTKDHNILRNTNYNNYSNPNPIVLYTYRMAKHNISKYRRALNNNSNHPIYLNLSCNDNHHPC